MDASRLEVGDSVRILSVPVSEAQEKQGLG